MTAAKNDVFIGLKFLFSGGIDFWCEVGVGGGGVFQVGEWANVLVGDFVYLVLFTI